MTRAETAAAVLIALYGVKEALAIAHGQMMMMTGNVPVAPIAGGAAALWFATSGNQGNMLAALEREVSLQGYVGQAALFVGIINFIMNNFLDVVGQPATYYAGGGYGGAGRMVTSRPDSP